MSEVKLFGKMIQLTSNDDVSDPSCGSYLIAVVNSERNSDHILSCSNASVSPKSIENSKSNAAMDSATENPGTISKDKEESDSSISQEEKPSKKSDRILPCPRCNSNDTKFCYFNNYNLNQPRHFCKKCQRYWTDGGTVRNVPVGSGRRKTKHNPLQPNPASINGYPETEQFPNKSFRGPNPKFNCFPAPPWYPAPIWSYGEPNSPLGKHSREGDLIKSKTLRIDDPSEAAKSSIWATLGIKNQKVDLIGSGGVFGGFQSKVGEMNSAADGSLVLHANPAAFSRSLRFHESAE
ncbi:hypothetical protein V2J09_015369 [Rumex salicifolius]